MMSVLSFFTNMHLPMDRPPNTRSTSTTSVASTPRIKPTTLDIPGLTKSKVSPDGRIAQRDIGSKLVIVMVGLPARGKSYITKKMARYLNWLQHDTRIFNVGERRRLAVNAGTHIPAPGDPSYDIKKLDREHLAAQALFNCCKGEGRTDSCDHPPIPSLILPEPVHGNGTNDVDFPDYAGDHARLEAQFGHLERPSSPDEHAKDAAAMEHTAEFFDPQNKSAAMIRESLAMETLHDLLDYVLDGPGSVGIFDATNSTLDRRKRVMETIRARAGAELNVLFIESLCKDENLLEANMRLKLSGPDYRDKDPEAALADFRKRVEVYAKNYVPIGEYEERNNMPYVQMIDVGRKVISHQVKGFLSAQAVYYLLNFNLGPRMIWITRHGESMDNIRGKVGGDSELSENGRHYAQAMSRFIDSKRKEWDWHQSEKVHHTHFPPQPGDHTPPNPYWGDADGSPKNFCVWTSMLKRSFQSSEYFDDEAYEIKQMRMLDELNAGMMEGLTYEEIRTKHGAEFKARQENKLQYRYPGPGGEGYLDVINRLRPVIVELERMTDHCLLIGHRSVARVLLAYFQGLKRDEVADVECPLGMLYCLEPKPYGVQFQAYKYNSVSDWFDLLPDYQLKREPTLN